MSRRQFIVVLLLLSLGTAEACQFDRLVLKPLQTILARVRAGQLTPEQKQAIKEAIGNRSRLYALQMIIESDDVRPVVPELAKSWQLATLTALLQRKELDVNLALKATGGTVGLAMGLPEIRHTDGSLHVYNAMLSNIPALLGKPMSDTQKRLISIASQIPISRIQKKLLQAEGGFTEEQAAYLSGETQSRALKQESNQEVRAKQMDSKTGSGVAIFPSSKYLGSQGAQRVAEKMTKYNNEAKTKLQYPEVEVMRVQHEDANVNGGVPRSTTNQGFIDKFMLDLKSRMPEGSEEELAAIRKLIQASHSDHLATVQTSQHLTKISIRVEDDQRDVNDGVRERAYPHQDGGRHTRVAVWKVDGGKDRSTKILSPLGSHVIGQPADGDTAVIANMEAKQGHQTKDSTGLLSVLHVADEVPKGRRRLLILIRYGDLRGEGKDPPEVN